MIAVDLGHRNGVESLGDSKQCDGVLHTAKLPLFAKRQCWEVVMHIHHQSDTRLLCRVADSRRSHQMYNCAVAAMIWP